MNTNHRIKITRKSENRYAVETGVLMSDGTYQQDGCMKLVGNVLRSHEEPGLIRVGGLMRINLGEKTLPQVLALGVRQEVIFFYA